MNDPLVISLTLTGAFLASSLVVACMLWIKAKKKADLLKNQLNASLVDSLELATGDQLLQELRKRSEQPYIILQPLHSKDQMGLSIEIHSMPPAMSLSIMKMAAFVTAKELKERGVDLSEVPEPPELDPPEEFDFGV